MIQRLFKWEIVQMGVPVSVKTTLTNLQDIATRSPSTLLAIGTGDLPVFCGTPCGLDLFCNRRFWSVTTSPHTLLRSLCSGPRTFM